MIARLADIAPDWDVIAADPDAAAAEILGPDELADYDAATRAARGVVADEYDQQQWYHHDDPAHDAQKARVTAAGRALSDLQQSTILRIIAARKVTP